jgi:multiple sugar transport system substrate-binding protein
MFEEAGLQTPAELYEQGKWDWDAFMEAMRALTKDTNGDGRPEQFGFQVPAWHSNIFELFYINGLDSIWTGENDEILNWDNPEVREVYALVHDLIWEEHVMPQPGDIDAYEGFTIGRVAMMITGSFTVGRLDALEQDWEYGFTYLPKHKKKHVTLYSNGVAMTTATKYKDQAWLFVRDFATTKGSELLAETKFGFPLVEEDYRSMNNDPIWEEALKIARPTQRHRRMSTARLVFQKHHAAYMDDPNGDLDAFIKAVVKEGSEALQEEL